MTVRPNVTYAAYLAACEASAQRAVKGLWTKVPPPTPKPTKPAGPSEPSPEIPAMYVGDADSGLFHLATCPLAVAMRAEDKAPFATREKAIAAGYEPCGVCQP